MNVRYRVTLTTEERQQLELLVRGGTGAVRMIKRAQILLAADTGSTDEVIAQNVVVGTSTVYRTRQRFVEEGLERALHEAPRPGAPRKLGAGEESLLVAVACSKPPDGRARWTLNLLTGEMVRLTSLETLSGDTVGRRLAEMALKPWQEKMWCIPTVNPEYVARMEDVLELYAEPPDPLRPVVCFDETPRQLIGEERVPIRAEPGKPRRYDYEYVRNGTANVFMFVDVNRPWRHAKVTDQRTCIDTVSDLGRLAQHFGLPEAKDVPAGCTERQGILTIPLDVPFDLGCPVIRVVAARELLEAMIEVATVPEVAIAEDHEAMFWEHDVRAARQPRNVRR